MRILFILDRAGTPAPKGSPTGAVKVVHAEKRMQALDFWIRNPDYLAHEFIERYIASSKSDSTLLDHAAAIMAGDEPEVRRLAMLRFLFGAWEALDDAVATLVSLGLADMRRKYNPEQTKIQQTNYYLLSAGQEKAGELSKDPVLNWYAERASLVAFIAGTDKGHTLKKRQYDVAEYHNARWGTEIKPIRDAVASRLQTLLSER